jgi:phosphoglucomutase/phosphomannomutase
MDKTALLDSISIGFKTLNVADKFKEEALKNIELWLSDPIYKEYIPQIEYLTEAKKWDLLLDSFYQVIPFGTGGRRGMVGIGPNRINGITITMSAQGHSQYLLQKYGAESATRGVVIAYDVRKFLKKGIFDDNRPNPVRELSCEDLAKMAAEVYAGNGIKVFLFKALASTPELSFTVRDLKALAGDMISASHNPPEFNGKKVVDEHGGQLIPPHDEELVNVVVNEVSVIKRFLLTEAEAEGLVSYLSEKEHEQYLNAASQIGLNDFRSARILYSSFHGTSHTSAYEVLKRKGFDVILDEQSSKPDPTFPSLMFNIPNPEVIEAYKNLMPNADKINADIIIVADPDGDRIGLMSKEGNDWRFYTGNEIMVLATAYLLEEKKKQGSLKSSNVIVKTAVTTNFLKVLAKQYDVQIVPDLLVGIKYVADIMNKLESEGRIADFLIGGEESHGSVSGNYIRDKDTSVPAVLVSELASREKDKGSTLGEYLDSLYDKFGYYRNYLTEIRLPGAEGMSKMALIQEDLRSNPPKAMGDFEIAEQLDFWKGDPFLSETDKVSRNVIILRFKPLAPFDSIQVTIRPSGTEPKTKMYFEIGMVPNEKSLLEEEKQQADDFLKELEKAVLKYCYKIIGIDFPDRGFLLFWQLAATEKMHYFEIEPEIEELIKETDKSIREQKLNELLEFLGSNPVEKVDKAFIAKNGKGIREYLNLI